MPTLVAVQSSRSFCTDVRVNFQVEEPVSGTAHCGCLTGIPCFDEAGTQGPSSVVCTVCATQTGSSESCPEVRRLNRPLFTCDASQT